MLRRKGRAGPQLVSCLSRGKETRIRAKSRQDEVLGTWQGDLEDWGISRTPQLLKKEMFGFIMKHNGEWEANQVPGELAHLLA
jgi:hypothetical protein